MTKRTELRQELIGRYGHNLRWQKRYAYRAENLREVVSVAVSNLTTTEADKRDGTDTFLSIERASGSDYMGGVLAEANHEAIYRDWRDWESEDGEGVVLRAYGGHGTFGILVNLDTATEDQLDEVLGALEHLERCGVYDEEVYLRIERERIDEALDDYILRTFAANLTKRFERAGYDDVWFDHRSDGVRELWNELFYARNGHYSIDVGGVVPSVKPEVLAYEANLQETLAIWSAMPEGTDLGLPVQPINQGQLWFDLTVFGFHALERLLGNVVIAVLQPQKAPETQRNRS